MNRYSLFISDLHLSSSTPKTTELFLGFLEAINSEVDALYILGDLFQFWIGDDDRSAFNEQIKTALKKASTKVPIYLMSGNRDFLLGKTFAAESGCALIPDPYVINLYGKKIILTHGDLLCTKDIKYHTFRSLIRFPNGITIFLKLPLAVRLWFAKKIQNYSAKTKSAKTIELLAAQTDDAKNILSKFDLNLIIHGHTHVAEIEELTLDNKQAQRVSLGEWNKQASILVYNKKHEIEFKAISY